MTDCQEFSSGPSKDLMKLPGHPSRLRAKSVAVLRRYVLGERARLTLHRASFFRDTWPCLMCSHA